MAIALFVGKFDKPAVSTGGGFRKAIFRGETRTMTTCNDPVCCYPPIGRETENRIKMIRSMEQAYKKRPPRATANSPPVFLADMGKLLYKSGKFIQCNSINDVQLSLMSHPFVMTKVTKRTTMKS